MTRAALALLVLAALPGGVAAQARTGEAPAAQRPASPAARPFGPTRLAPTFNEPLGLGPRVPPGGGQPAPVPNRGIEAPRDRYADSLAPTLEPMLLPPERRPGATFGREHLRETGPDRPFDSLVPGARLRIPLEPSGPR